VATARFKGTVIAQSDETQTVEGNPYFPPDSLKREFFKDSAKTTVCGWKGTANYYDVTVDGETAAAAAWYYAEPKRAAANIAGFVAFWGDIVVEP